jgi:hypothetical protein
MIAVTEQQLQAGSPVAQDIAARLGNARCAFEAAVEHFIAAAPANANAAYAGAVPYLMLAGNLVASWQMARSVLVAEAALARGEDSAFMATKITTAQFYAHHILPEVDLQRSRVLHGAASLLGVTF